MHEFTLIHHIFAKVKEHAHGAKVTKITLGIGRETPLDLRHLRNAFALYQANASFVFPEIVTELDDGRGIRLRALEVEVEVANDDKTTTEPQPEPEPL
jgi:hypothetical protein